MRKKNNISIDKTVTSIEQSKKLMELGLDINTADFLWKDIHKKNAFREISRNIVRSENDCPAWSLKQLLDICNKKPLELSNSVFFVTVLNNKVLLIDKPNNEDICIAKVSYSKSNDVYDNLIDCMEELIGSNMIDKSLLKTERNERKKQI